MPREIACPSCKTTLTVSSRYAGRKGKCRVCQERFLIPSFDETQHPRMACSPFSDPGGMRVSDALLGQERLDDQT
jgi:hypothetical protein